MFPVSTEMLELETSKLMQDLVHLRKLLHKIPSRYLFALLHQPADTLRPTLHGSLNIIGPANHSVNYLSQQNIEEAHRPTSLYSKEPDCRAKRILESPNVSQARLAPNPKHDTKQQVECSVPDPYVQESTNVSAFQPCHHFSGLNRSPHHLTASASCPSLTKTLGLPTPVESSNLALSGHRPPGR